MRDIAVVIYFAIMLFLAFKRPSIGLAVWVWTAFISPHYLVYGFGRGIRYNLIAALVTILVYFVYKNKARMAKGPLVTLVFFFFFWTIISTVFSIYDSPIIIRELDRFFRGILLFLFALLILDNKKDFTITCWAIVLSLGFYSGVEGLKFISSGGSHNIFGPSGTNLHDNNHLALALNMMLPFAFFLISDIKNKFMRLGFIIFIGVSLLAIVGTFSRGGFVGLAILILSLILVSKKKFSILFLSLIISISVISYIPDTYTARISTIENAETDGSLMGRFVAWKQSTLIALDNPLTGGGFYAVQTASVWRYYALTFDTLDFIETSPASDYNFKAAHSIYFQVLGDHGFFGLILYLSIFIGAGLKARKISKNRSLPPDYEWVIKLGNACFLSLLMFGVCGSLLSLAYFELSFFIVGILCCLQKIINRVNEQGESAKKGKVAYVAR